MVNLQFHKFSEKAPKHNEHVLWFNPVGFFGSLEVSPEPGKVEYSWEEIDRDGYPTGHSFCYNGEAEIPSCRLMIAIGPSYASDSTYWVSTEEVLDLVEADIEDLS